MMSALDRPGDAFRVQCYLHTTGGFGDLAVRVAAADSDPPTTAAVAGDMSAPAGPTDTDARGALEHIRGVLTSLLGA